jgi:flagellar hook-length control protein FliK
MKAAPAQGSSPAPSLASAKSAILAAVKTASGPSLEDARSEGAFKLAADSDAPPSQGQSQSAAAAPDASAAAQGLATSGLTATAAAATPAPGALASAHGADITAQLASQIAAKADAGKSAFDFALEPQGLGRVDVSLKIDSQGQLSAVLSFDNPGAAAEAKSRAGDLQQALQQAGLNVSQSGLSFTSGGGHGGGAAAQHAAPTYAASVQVADAAADAPIAPTASGRGSAGGVDITI